MVGRFQELRNELALNAILMHNPDEATLQVALCERSRMAGLDESILSCSTTATGDSSSDTSLCSTPTF